MMKSNKWKLIVKKNKERKLYFDGKK